MVMIMHVRSIGSPLMCSTGGKASPDELTLIKLMLSKVQVGALRV